MDGLSFLRAIGALAFTLGLLIGCAALLKRYSHKFVGFSIPSVKMADKRMRIIESISLDARHRLMLVKIDASEHLILIGPNSSTITLSTTEPQKKTTS